MSTREIIQGNRVTVREYNLYYELEECPGAGYSFPCDADGNVEVDSMQPLARENYERLSKNHEGYHPPVVEDVVCGMYTVCHCGSGKPNYEDTDARGFGIGMVCEDCEAQNRRKYNPAIFKPGFQYEEPLYEDDY